MKVAFAGDWHGNGFWAVQAIKYAREQGADVIVHLGDFGYDFFDDYLDRVQGALRRNDLELWFVDGNHENFPKLYNQWEVNEDGRRSLRPRIFHLPRGYRWDWVGHKFLALGGAYSVDRDMRVLDKSWWAEEVISDEDVEKAAAGGQVDFLISHDCPTGVRIPGLEKGSSYFPQWALDESYVHRQQLTKVVEAVRPTVIVHGHYHRRYHTFATLNLEDPRDNTFVYGLDCDGSSLKDNMMFFGLRGNGEWVEYTEQ